MGSCTNIVLSDIFGEDFNTKIRNVSWKVRRFVPHNTNPNFHTRNMMPFYTSYWLLKEFLKTSKFYSLCRQSDILDFFAFLRSVSLQNIRPIKLSVNWLLFRGHQILNSKTKSILLILVTYCAVWLNFTLVFESQKRYAINKIEWDILKNIW